MPGLCDGAEREPRTLPDNRSRFRPAASARASLSGDRLAGAETKTVRTFLHLLAELALDVLDFVFYVVYVAFWLLLLLTAVLWVVL